MKNWERAATTAQRLKEAMEQAGMKQADLVSATGLNKSTISRYLSGSVEPKQKAVMSLSAALGVSEMWLWGYDVPKNRSPEQKKNDDLVKVIVQMRKDTDFFEVVSLLAELPQEQYASIKQLISVLGNK